MGTPISLPAVGEDDVQFLPIQQLSPADLVCVLDRLHRDAEHLEDEGEPPDEAVAACVQLGLSRPPMRPVLTEPPGASLPITTKGSSTTTVKPSSA